MDGATGRYDLLVVGGGPAGMAAATTARELGLHVALVDERPSLGGQIYKQPGEGFVVRDHAALGRDHVAGRVLIDATQRSGAHVLLRTSVLTLRDGDVVLHTEGEPVRTVRAGRVLLAPGAHDRPVVFPGWDLPGVLTAGGAQTLVKTQRVAPGERVLFAGSGPLALAFPAQLHGYGVNVVAALEAGPPPAPRDALRLLGAARGNRQLLLDGLRYRAALLRGRVPLRYRRIVVRAEGGDRLAAVVHAAVDSGWRVLPGTEERIEVDTLCLGYGFFPSVELMRVAGCALRYDEDLGGPVVELDEWMRTSVPGVLAAGDGTGVAGALVAVDEGRLAAIGAALDLGRLPLPAARERARPLRARLDRKRVFREALGRLYRVGPGVYDLATADTVVCRCEEVTCAAVDRAAETTADVNVVKGYTRAGMGLCQGRSCQRQVAARVARRHGLRLAEVPTGTPRSPVRPVPASAVADEQLQDGGFFTRDA
ncbi:FAD-dependent oxidoreductase [Blastococcus sp. MG754426]|uniref:NAD(P)/FAD-dependent oxidoreductase n=1 Tax=unclassified Blastococcus TaxID=2619396 RepID=UPI001EEFDB71|nr:MULTISPECIES: NAD(P)/FAD-dependent oxidoreductase [unclassified Blastococcus]MCF6508123.1 FAD-dependent oxidoreductase [Blastococcus sp. MG754426]MCF6511548.1 FAD-dependent oxidoreductase [Blastococcus sp. MG754427]